MVSVGELGSDGFNSSEPRRGCKSNIAAIWSLHDVKARLPRETEGGAMAAEEELAVFEAALEEARRGYATKGIPIGSVLAEGGKIVGRGHNKRVQEGDAI